MVDGEPQKLAQQHLTQQQMMAAAAKAMQETAARVSPEVFGDTSKLSVFLPDGVVAFNDLMRVGPGPHRPSSLSRSERDKIFAQGAALELVGQLGVSVTEDFDPDALMRECLDAGRQRVALARRGELRTPLIQPEPRW